MKTAFLLLVRVLALTAVVAAFLGVPFCHYAVRAQDLAWGLLLTLLLGRFFCSALCPLGIIQSFAAFLRHPRSQVRRVCTRLPETNAQRIVRWTIFSVLFVLAVCGLTGFATLLSPISVFGKAISGWMPGVVLMIVVVAMSFAGKGRVWCNWVCPYGTLYSVVSRFAIVRNKVGKGCGNCRLCFENSTVDRKNTTVDSQATLTRRDTLCGVAAVAATEKVVDGGYAPVTPIGSPDRGFPLLPPGAGSRFAQQCIGCQLCVTNCPGKCLKPSVSLKDFGQPRMDFREGYCLSGCTRCGEVCPAGALLELQQEMRKDVHIGYAVWDREKCIRTTDKTDCRACVRKCPVRAIHLVGGFPVVDRDACIGCGACEHACPSRPMPAIYVKGLERQRIVKPISTCDLVLEMKALVSAGASVVVAQDGRIVAKEEGRGIAPLLKLLDEGKLSCAIVVDKVIGRAAAAVCICGGVKQVHAALAGEGAAKLLTERRIDFEADKTVPVIMNREKSGPCPMEKAVEKLDEPVAMVAAVRTKLEELKKEKAR